VDYQPEWKRGPGSQDLEDLMMLKDRALSATAEGITISDPRLPDNPIIYANAGFQKLTGYAIPDVLGKNCRFLQGPETNPATVSEIRKALREERSCTVEILNYRKDGSPFWNRLSITPIRNSRGDTTHFIGVQSDITGQKSTESALRRLNEQLESARNRLQKDLEAAAMVQQSLLPKEAPEMKDLSVAWLFKPCQELAGDILNIVPLGPSQIGFYVLDVSGHGVSAALLSVSLNQWLSPLPRQSCLFHPSPKNPSKYRITPPAEVAEQLNRQFPMDLETGKYFTILYGVLDTKRLTFRYVSAGHPPPVHIPAGQQAGLIESSGFPIGMVRNPEYQDRVIKMKAGDRLYLYTDGIPESNDHEEREFGIERVMKVLNRNRGRSVQESLDNLMHELEEWRSDRSLHDDVTILGFEIKKPVRAGKGQKTILPRGSGKVP
jgi:PAS domain S-box-containing protein